MKVKIVFALVLVLIAGVCAGWFASAHWEKKIRKTQSVMALVTANDAAQNGDLDKAIEYSAYALAFDNESPLADIQLKEFFKKRTAKISDNACKAALTR